MGPWYVHHLTPGYTYSRHFRQDVEWLKISRFYLTYNTGGRYYNPYFSDDKNEVLR